MILMIRYSNRKIYAKSGFNKYFNGNELLDLIKNNQEFKILDFKSGKDITHISLVNMAADLLNKGAAFETVKMLLNKLK